MTDNTLYQRAALSRLRLAQRASTFDGMVFHPPTDVYETDATVIVIVEVAGLQEGDYEVLLSDSGRTLTIAGRRQARGNQAGPFTFHRLEIQYGAFVSQVEVPWALEGGDAAEAIYEDGFLVISLPKARPRQVPVRAVSDMPNESG